ncbi:unnamed protein product [Candidula unifasciata]|uniref:ZMYM2-like/QRICH1 C-terminal domain-containing protein n=1 Tax=Candidula unifasciata TaxID=100452 RepID=A0A8S3Z869_9EUPU|nr:unnamed protein product [Candidula unifasciata]
MNSISLNESSKSGCEARGPTESGDNNHTDATEEEHNKSDGRDDGDSSESECESGDHRSTHVGQKTSHITASDDVDSHTALSLKEGTCKQNSEEKLSTHPSLTLFSNGPVFPARHTRDLQLSQPGLDLSTPSDNVDTATLELSSATKKAILSFIDTAEADATGRLAASMKIDVQPNSPKDNAILDSSSLEAFMKNPSAALSGDVENESLAPLNASFFSCQYQTPNWIDDPLVGVPASAMENKNTHRKTGADMRILTAYMRSLNEMRLPEAIPPTELDKYLSSFFLVVRKADGSEYEPCSLRAMLASIERYLRFKNYPLSLTRDSAFSNMRNVLKLKQQTLRSIGKGQKTPSEVSPSSLAREGKIAHLFKSQEMGPYTPSSVVFTLCFYFCMYLRLRKSTENKKLLWGDIILCKDESGREFLTFSSQMLRRAQGSSKMNVRQRNYRVWADPSCPEKDPVTIYKFYAQKRPASMNTNFAPFYLGINVLYPTQGQLWYRPAAMGINKLNEMVRQIRDITGVRSTSDFHSGAHVAEKKIFDLDVTGQGERSPQDDLDDHRDSQIDVKTEVMDDSDDDDCSSNLAIDFTQEQHDPPLDCSQNNTASSLSVHYSITPTGMVQAVYSDRDNSSDSFSQQSFPTNANGEVAQDLSNGDHSQEIDLTTGSSPDSPLNCSTKGRASYDSLDYASHKLSSGVKSSDALSMSEAKLQLLDIVRKMELSDVEEFNHWLKNVSFSADPLSGHIVYKEEERDERKEPMSVKASSSNGTLGASITLNISLTPQALQGDGPITVTAQTSISPEQPRISNTSLNHLGKINSHPAKNSLATSKTLSSFFPSGKPANFNLTPSGQYSPDKPLDLATSPVSRHIKSSSSSSSLQSQTAKSNWLAGSNGILSSLTSNNSSNSDSPLAKRLRLSAEQAEAYASASIMASLSSANFVNERLRLQLMQAGLRMGDYNLDTHTSNLMDLTSSEVLRSQLLQHYGIKSEPK